MNAEYPGGWDTPKSDIHRRDDFKCQNCGRLGGAQGLAKLRVHFVIPRSRGGSSARSNLITVCQECHQAIHEQSETPGQIPDIVSSSSEFDSRTSAEENLDYVIERETKSANALEQLAEMVDGTDGGKTSPVDEYAATRHVVISQAFHIRNAVQRYSSLFQDYLNGECATDIEQCESTAWDGIEAKIGVVDALDDVFLELDKLDIQCGDCGKTVSSKDTYCKHCGSELHTIPECPSCGEMVTPDTNFCSNCGSDMTEINESVELIEESEGSDDVSETAERIQNAIDTSYWNIILLERFRYKCIKNREQPWHCCTNCGLEDGVFVTSGKARCILCGRTWAPKGILNSSWEPNQSTGRHEELMGKLYSSSHPSSPPEERAYNDILHKIVE